MKALEKNKFLCLNFTLSNAKSKIKKTDFPLINNFFLYKIILFYIKGVCIASNVKKLLIHLTYNLLLIKLGET